MSSLIFNNFECGCAIWHLVKQNIKGREFCADPSHKNWNPAKLRHVYGDTSDVIDVDEKDFSSYEKDADPNYDSGYYSSQTSSLDSTASLPSSSFEEENLLDETPHQQERKVLKRLLDEFSTLITDFGHDIPDKRLKVYHDTLDYLKKAPLPPPTPSNFSPVSCLKEVCFDCFKLHTNLQPAFECCGASACLSCETSKRPLCCRFCNRSFA